MNKFSKRLIVILTVLLFASLTSFTSCRSIPSTLEDVKSIKNYYNNERGGVAGYKELQINGRKIFVIWSPVIKGKKEYTWYSTYAERKTNCLLYLVDDGKIDSIDYGDGIIRHFKGSVESNKDRYIMYFYSPGNLLIMTLDLKAVDK